jgi:hypothetical protein
VFPVDGLHAGPPIIILVGVHPRVDAVSNFAVGLVVGAGGSVDLLRKILRGLFQPCQPHSGSVIAAGLRVAHKNLATGWLGAAL